MSLPSRIREGDDEYVVVDPDRFVAGDDIDSTTIDDPGAPE